MLILLLRIMKNGDIVVRNKICQGPAREEMPIGKICKINANRGTTSITLDENDGWWNVTNYRLATPLEIWNYKQGIRHIDSINTPKKFYIARNEENYKVINSWINKKYDKGLMQNDNYVCSPPSGRHNISVANNTMSILTISTLILEGYILIDFEDFQNYVLHQKVRVLEEIKLPEITIFGEKVEFIKQSIQLGNITLTLKDLELLKRLQAVSKENEISFHITDTDILLVKHEDSDELHHSFKELETIINTLKETNEDTKILTKGV